MKKLIFCLSSIITTILLSLMISCNQSTVEPNVNFNLIKNGSFEVNNIPTLSGWRLGNQQLAQLVNDAAPNGGQWSLQLTSDWAPTSGYAYYTVTNLNSGDIVELSAYVRTSGSFKGRGIIELSYKNHLKFTYSSDSVWTKINVIDTLNLTQRDTLNVILSSPITEIVPFQQQFDVIELKKINNVYDKK